MNKHDDAAHRELRRTAQRRGLRIKEQALLQTVRQALSLAQEVKRRAEALGSRTDVGEAYEVAKMVLAEIGSTEQE